MQEVLGYDVRELFDPVQTHAAYRVPSDQIDHLQQHLKSEHNATRFRRVKTMISGIEILCFKLK
jgi:hypothetical protein